MIANVDNVIKWLQTNNLDYWRVQLKEGDNSYVFESDDAGFDANVKRFREVMELSQGSRFYLKANSKGKASRGNFYEEFRNTPDGVPALSQVQGVPQVQGIPQDEVDRRINAAIEGLKTQQRMEALESENKELKQDIKDMQTPINRVITKIEPYIGTLLATVVSKIIPSAPAIEMAGIEHIEESENQYVEHEAQKAEHESENPDQERLMKALEKWAAADPEFIDLIEAVANMAATKDPMYNMAKGMLKK